MLLLGVSGIGGIVPNIDLLSSFRGDALNTMLLEVSGNTTNGNDDQLLDPLQFNEKQTKEAYPYVYRHLFSQENKGVSSDTVGETNWKPAMTGLCLVKAPLGMGPSMWVSEAGRQEFEEKGEGAIKKVVGEKQ